MVAGGVNNIAWPAERRRCLVNNHNNAQMFSCVYNRLSGGDTHACSRALCGAFYVPKTTSS